MTHNGKDKSSALPSYYYRDPAEVYERKESATCKGCAHIDEMFGKEFCGKNPRRFPKKCKLWKAVE